MGLKEGLGLGVWGLGLGVWGLGFGVWGLGFRVWGLGFGVQGYWLRARSRIEELGFRVWGLGLWVAEQVRGPGLWDAEQSWLRKRLWVECSVWALEFRTWDSGFKFRTEAWDFGFRALGFQAEGCDPQSLTRQGLS